MSVSEAQAAPAVALLARTEGVLLDPVYSGKGMAGLIEEGEEVIDESKKKDDAPADLALIGAALRVEHYEVAAYTTARNLALQLHLSAIAEYLTMSLGEELNAAQLLDQAAQPLMTVARMPAAVE